MITNFTNAKSNVFSHSLKKGITAFITLIIIVGKYI